MGVAKYILSAYFMGKVGVYDGCASARRNEKGERNERN